MPVIHPFPPVWDEQSRILILGSFPSVRSRETGFYYGHPQNRFWRVLAQLYHEPVPCSIEERRNFALRHGIALWDTIQNCEISGSSDASIRNAIPNDIASLLQKAPVERIFCNGRRSWELYARFCEPHTGMKAILLPSTSPANAAWSLDQLAEAWKQIL